MDASKVKAKLLNGELHITVPKPPQTAESKAKMVAIEEGSQQEEGGGEGKESKADKKGQGSGDAGSSGGSSESKEQLAGQATS